MRKVTPKKKSVVKKPSPQKCSTGVLALKTKKDIPQSVWETVRSVTAHMETMPVGTFKYKVFKYPGDIDIFETLDGCCTYNAAKVGAAEKITNIVRKLNDENMMFIEFKAGYDNRFKLNIGYLSQDKLEDYNYTLVMRDLENVRQFFTRQEYETLQSMVKQEMSPNDFIILSEELRKYWVMRWNKEEMLQGFKVLRGNTKLYLDDALSHGSIVKLDVIAIVDDGKLNRYVEVTNFFNIIQTDKYGGKTILTEELKDYGQSLLADVYKYKDDNTLKAVKRLWMYLAFKKDICTLNMFTPLFSSTAALYSQIVADLEVVMSLYSGNVVFDRVLVADTIRSRLLQLKGECMPKGFDIEMTTLGDVESIMVCLRSTVTKMTKQWLSDMDINLDDVIKNAEKM